MELLMPTDVLLWSILGGVLAGPFASRKIERNLELFFLIMGAVAVTIASHWSWRLLYAVLREPVLLTGVVLAVGCVFHVGRTRYSRMLSSLLQRIPVRLLVGLLTLVVGCLASVITAIIASMLVVEAVSTLRLGREDEVRITVISCYSIGLGAALTPVGEPLSTIVTARMSGHFWYLLQLVGSYILPGIVGLSIFAGLLRYSPASRSLTDLEPERGLAPALQRALRIYVFVAALLLLGEGLSPLVDRYIARLTPPYLYWANIVSAILDNATLAAAETGPALSPEQLTAVLLGLLVSGGMLIPGNVPNIVAANHLGIRSSEWARFAVPLGLALMLIYFAAWMIVTHPAVVLTVEPAAAGPV